MKFKRLPSEKTLKEIYHTFNERYFNNELPADAKVEWSEKMTRNAGACIPRKKVIRISWHYAKSFPKDVENILVHEMIHLKFPNHGAQFHKEVDRINSCGEDINVARFSLGRAKDPKYRYVCTECGAQFPRDKKVNTERYKCGRCMGSLELPPDKQIAEEEE